MTAQRNCFGGIHICASTDQVCITFNISSSPTGIRRVRQTSSQITNSSPHWSLSSTARCCRLPQVLPPQLTQPYFSLFSPPWQSKAEKFSSLHLTSGPPRG